MLRKLLTTGVAANNDTCFNNVKKKHHPLLQLIILTKHLLTAMTMQVMAVASCCAMVSPFAFFWCFSFSWKAATWWLLMMTTMQVSAMATSCCTMVSPSAFFCCFLFLQAGSNSTTADNDDNRGNGHGNPLLHNSLSFCLFLVFFVFTGRQQLDNCRQWWQLR